MLKKAACFVAVGLFSFFGCFEAKAYCSQKEVDRFRNHLKAYFAQANGGREIRFNNADVDYYSKVLAEKMRAFLNERENLNCAQFYDSCFDYLKSTQAKSDGVKVLSRPDFENLLNSSGKNFCRLFVGVRSNVFAEAFKKGQIFSDSAKKYSLSEEAKTICPFSQYVNQYCGGGAYQGLCAFYSFENALLESRQFDEGQLVFPGLIGEVAVHNLNVVDLSFLEEVLAVVKANNPQEFGLYDEIARHFSENDENKMAIELKSKESVESKYNSVLFTVFSNYSKMRDEFFKQKTGESIAYADVDLKFNLEQKQNYEEKLKPFYEELYEKTIDLGFESEFVSNKTLALTLSYGVIAKLLGFDAIKFNMSCYKSELSGNNEEGFCLVNSAKVEAVCNELKPSGCDKYEVERIPLGCLK